MKTSTYTIAFITLLISSFSSVANSKTTNSDELKRLVPLAPKATITEILDIPENLSFIKAKNALVPNAPFNLVSPLDRVFELTVISPKLFLGNPDHAPRELARIKAKNAFVPLAPRIQGNAQLDIPKVL